MKNPYVSWKQSHVNSEWGMKNLFDHFNSDKPLTGGFDVESTGLHIIKDKPFLIQFGWLVPKQDFGRVFTFYPTKENMEVFLELAKRLKFFIAHNVKYDCHMLSNIGYATKVQAMTNLCDSMFLARLALEAIPSREGGDSLKLKDLGKKYVHPDAARSESMIKDELNKLNAERIKVLSAALKQFPLKGETTPTGRQKFWGKGAIEKFLKDPTNDVEDLPDGVKDVWVDWLEEYPEPTYEDVPRDIMLKYGAEDIITMLEFFKKAYPIVKDREQLGILEMEMKCILPMYRMERVGLKVDMGYLQDSRLKVKAYITELRNEMYELMGERLTVNQHDKIKAIFKQKWDIHLESDDSPNMKNIMKNYEGEPYRLAELIKGLRSLEKWYSTYILPIIKNAEYDGKVYTQLNQAGAVSGRMSSNFQQFPKKALKTLEGVELYHPRKPFIPKGEGYESIVYIDYDQIELVTQAHYTLLVSGGDLNLCRAYMPFKCRHYRTGSEFNYEGDTGRAKWNEVREDFTWEKLKPLLKDKDDKLDIATAMKYGFSAWLDEKGKPWTKTDVHGQTTHKAFPHIPLGTDEFKEWRNKGKMFNFMANYGGGKMAAVKALDLKEDEADALVRGYNEAFPHVIVYQKGIQRAHQNKGYVQNHYGRRYYLEDTGISYKLANYNIQGTCADALKMAIIDLDAYLLDKKTKMVIPIHDEIQFDVHKSEKGIESELLKIMQEAFYWCLVPVSAGVEYTKTNWSEKEGV